MPPSAPWSASHGINRRAVLMPLVALPLGNTWRAGNTTGPCGWAVATWIGLMVGMLAKVVLAFTMVGVLSWSSRCWSVPSRFRAVRSSAATPLSNGMLALRLSLSHLLASSDEQARHWPVSGTNVERM